VSESSNPGETIIALECAAFSRWCKGDPSGFLEICAEDVVYFDPFVERRVDGLAALAAYYDGLRGKFSAERWELLNPRVQHAGNLAVLTFNFLSYRRNGDDVRWNCTEVYRKDAPGWRIIHTHWSRTKSD
jgi:ketosteroid isomerase-like protein